MAKEETQSRGERRLVRFKRDTAMAANLEMSDTCPSYRKVLRFTPLVTSAEKPIGQVFEQSVWRFDWMGSSPFYAPNPIDLMPLTAYNHPTRHLEIHRDWKIESLIAHFTRA